MKCSYCEGGHVGNRRRVGPTGRQLYNILVDTCYTCGALFPVQELKVKQRNWVERYNKRMKEYYELREIAKSEDPDLQRMWDIQ